MFNDKLNEECGIFGGHTKDENIAPIIIKGLEKLQHRGQESAGISVGADKQNVYKNLGFVKDVFKSLPTDLTGKFGIGHVRYSTQGKSDIKNAQPILIKPPLCDISIAHNGNIKLEDSLNSDTEMILQTIIEKCENFSFEKIGKCLEENFSLGAYSLALFLPEKIFAYRDTFGYRPLFFCEAKEGFFIASEDVAFKHLNPIKISEIQAGFGVEISSSGYEIKQFASQKEEKKCVFEPIYFSSAKSHVFGMKISETRQKLGELLASRDDVKADIVVPIPESGVFAALGYSTKSNTPYSHGLVLKTNSGRSFILPNQEARTEKVREKLSVDTKKIQDKKIILIDDSVVRGTTSKEVIKMLRAAGAKEIHFRLSSPMIINSCFWGVDIPNKHELLAHSLSEDEIAKELGADSVKFLQMDELKEFFGQNGWCYNCFMNSAIKQEERHPEFISGSHGRSFMRC